MTPLVAVKGRVVAFNGAPYSTDSSDDTGWNSATSNGARLLANLLLFKGVVQPQCNATFVCFFKLTHTINEAQIRVLICHSTGTDAANAVQTILATSALFAIVDVQDCRMSTPTAAALSSYHIVMAWSGGRFENNTALGDVLVNTVFC